MDALALTDAGNMHGAIEFYKAAINAGIKPILGVDAYLAPRSRHEKDLNVDAKRSRIVLLAENNEGYKNLLALVTKSWTEGFLERPRIDKELLRAHSRGAHRASAIICRRCRPAPARGRLRRRRGCARGVQRYRWRQKRLS